MKNSILIFLAIIILVVIGFFASQKINLNPYYEVGEKIDSLNDVTVYYNGGVGNVENRRLAKDGYNLGLKYQCVEFVKRYYYEAFDHKMPDTYGHAKDFFNKDVKDGQINKQRDLIQFTNASYSKPQISDLVVYSGTILNRYGHVSIISQVNEDSVEIIQQNPGSFGNSRETYKLLQIAGKWKIANNRIVGWLRK